MRLVAFSDYRTQSLDELKIFIKALEPRPDIILYAGDDIERFGYPRKRLHYSLLRYKMLHGCNSNFCFGRDRFHFFEPNTFFFSLKSAKNEYNEKSTRIKIAKEILKAKNKLIEFNDSINLGIEDLDQPGIDIERLLRIIPDEEEGIDEECLASFIRHVSSAYRNEIGKLNLEEIATFLNEKSELYLEKNEKYIYGYIYLYPKPNIFKDLSIFSNKGVCGVLGNDDELSFKEILEGEKVFNVHEQPLIQRGISIIGLQGASAEIKPVGRIGYSQDEIRDHLESMWSKLIDNEKNIILLSHTPPFGILDFSRRFGERNIGSKALRDFLEDRNILIAICGHSHNNGGKVEDFEDVKVINVASHDSFFDPANIAVIDITNNGKIKITWNKIPSNFELLIKNQKIKEEDKRERLRDIGFYNSDVDALFEGINHSGGVFVNEVHKLNKIKFDFGFSWRHLVEFYKIGVRREEDITDEIINHVSNVVRPGLSKNILNRAYLKLKASLNGRITHRGDLSPLFYPKKVYFDTEYLDVCVLYGFLVDNKLTQFVIEEESDMIKLIKELIKEDYKFYFYGGSDRKILINTLKKFNTISNIREIKNQFINVYHLISVHVGLLIDNYSLINILEYLYPEREKTRWTFDKFSGESILPYYLDGFDKIYLMNDAIKAIKKGIPIDEIETLNFLKKANKTDLEMLKLVTDRLEKLAKTI